MSEVSIIGIDLAKRVFQVHGSSSDGKVVYRKKLRREEFLSFLASQPRCIVAMEACGTASYWGRAIGILGHTVKLIAPQYVKPYVKRQKNDAADAEAVAEAASRPTMRFVPVKTEAQQSRAAVFRNRDLLVRQRTQLMNALRGTLAEFGIIAPQGLAGLKRLRAELEDETSPLPSIVLRIGLSSVSDIDALTDRISSLDAVLRETAKEGVAARLQTMPGVGPITAMAIETFAPPMDHFANGRCFSAWLGLAPKQHSTGGKTRLGKTQKSGQRDIRRLLTFGAMSVIQSVLRGTTKPDPWLARMMASRKPRILIAIALANRMARRIWAMATKQENYRNSVSAV